jgi:serine protease Do
MPRSATAILALAVALALPAIGGEEPTTNARLHTLVRQHAAGMNFPEVVAKNGTSFRRVVIKEVSEASVRFSHADGEATLPAADCPALWADLFGFARAGGGQPPQPAKAKSAVQTGNIAARSIAVIEGDRSNGTGFFCRAEGQVYLYTAAHVISGNARLQVKLRDGTVVRKFGMLEAAEGADLIRLPVEEEIADALEIAPESGLAKVGEEVLASGNAAGMGTVGFEQGRILGVGPASIEIDAEVIQGNSGGPILHAPSGRAMGVVTHLTAAREDRWAKDTRFSEVRRFGCRLDREWEWKKLPVEAFLKEGKAILSIQDQSELMMAALQPSQWKGEVFRRLSSNPLARDIAALDTWIEEQRSGGQKFSETDRKKRLRGVLESARHRSRSQMAGFNHNGYTWFHRDAADKEIQNRTEIDQAYEISVMDLR